MVILLGRPSPVHQTVEECLEVFRVHCRRRLHGFLGCWAVGFGGRAEGLAFLETMKVSI